MARQSFIWTALPNGYTDDGLSLRLSILMSPRLDPQAAPHRLDSYFPDWEDWPAQLRAAHFDIRFGGDHAVVGGNVVVGSDRLDDRLGIATSAVWKALFKGDRFVRPYVYPDLSDHGVLSYDTVALADTVTKLYRDLAARAGDELPLVSHFVDDREWGSLIKRVGSIDASSVDRETGLRDPARQFARLEGGRGTSLGLLEQFQLFHTPPAKSSPRKESRSDDPRITTQWREHARQPLPTPAALNKELDFHQIVSAMGSYPLLLRKLGLVVDLLIDPAHFQPTADGALSIAVSFDPGTFTITRTEDATPITRAMLTADRFEAVSDPTAELRVDRGLLDLDPDRFRLLQLDVDGAGLKLLNFARSLGRRHSDESRVDPVTRQEDGLGAPSLRTSGLMLVQRDRRSFLRSRFISNKGGNGTLEGQFQGAAGTVTLHAEDLVRGYRFDVWDSATTAWRSLCRRTARYDLDDGIAVDAAPEEEATIRLAATKSSDPASNANLLYLHEAVVSWTGWSLAAPPPGRSIRPDDSVDSSQAQSEAEGIPGLTFKSTFRAVPGSLPRLRFGRSYAMRGRAVDLAGNSLPFQATDFGPEKPQNNVAPYLRYEPVAAPVVALLSHGGFIEVPHEGESVARIAIRSFNATSADNFAPTAQVSRRAAVPPQASVREAEHHGMLDSSGKLDASRFTMLAHRKDIDPRDPASAVREVSIPMHAPFSDPVDTVFAVHEAGRALTYLPDPLATEVAARLLDHPLITDSEIISIPLYPEGSWPEARSFEIEVYEDDSAQPDFDAALRRLRIPLPKAARARLRLSMKLSAESLSQMAIFALLPLADRAAQQARARDGQHWMLTPWREIELVHAVQKPLLEPDITSLIIDRGLDDTSARPIIMARCSIASTDRLDLFAEWHEPKDIPGDDGAAAPTDRTRQDFAFPVKITGPRDYAQQIQGLKSGGHGEHVITGDDLVGINVTTVASHGRPMLPPKAHEFHDTRYRRIEYHFAATSRFREYMPIELLTSEQGVQSIPTDTNIKVEGARIVGWIPNSAPPPPPIILYAIPTFGWQRRTEADGKQLSERHGGGLRIYLDRGWNASGYGEMLAVVLTPAGFAGDPDAEPKGHPYRTYVTQWANDPIWDSPFVKGIAPKRSDFPSARFAPDPTGRWLPPGAPPGEADQKPGTFTVTGLRPPRSTRPSAVIEVAPHDVFYDPDRALWYCDITIDTGPSYFPFIRLALARYQPTSCPGAWLSNIVLADMMALTADRWLSFAPTDDPDVRRVSLFGSRPSETSGHTEAAAAPSMVVFSPVAGLIEHRSPAVIAATTVIELWIERLEPLLGDDFGWSRVPGVHAVPDPPRPAPIGGNALFTETKALKHTLLGSSTLWEGTITIPPAEGRSQRIVIAEYEEYLVDDDLPYDRVPTKKDRRLVYLEHIKL